MQVPGYILILGALSLVILLVVIIVFYMRSRKVNLTTPNDPDTKPDWIINTPPEETMAATLADGEGITVYDYDEGEHVAAPFAEQIEDILQAKLKADPQLAALNVDLGTNEATGEMEVWVDGTRYEQIGDIPNPQLQTAIQEAVAKWNEHMDSQ